MRCLRPSKVWFTRTRLSLSCSSAPPAQCKRVRRELQCLAGGQVFAKAGPAVVQARQILRVELHHDGVGVDGRGAGGDKTGQYRQVAGFIVGQLGQRFVQLGQHRLHQRPAQAVKFAGKAYLGALHLLALQFVGGGTGVQHFALFAQMQALVGIGQYFFAATGGTGLKLLRQHFCAGNQRGFQIGGGRMGHGCVSGVVGGG